MLTKRERTFSDVKSLKFDRLGVVDHGREIWVNVGGGACVLDLYGRPVARLPLRYLLLLFFEGRRRRPRVLLGFVVRNHELPLQEQIKLLLLHFRLQSLIFNQNFSE